MRTLSRASLPDPWRQLIDRMESLGFGSLHGVVIRDGDPVLDPKPRIIRERKYPNDNLPRTPRTVEAVLREQVVELIGYCRQLGNGVIETLEVKHGLPFRTFVVEEGA